MSEIKKIDTVINTETILSKETVTRQRAVQEILKQMELITREDFGEIIEKVMISGIPRTDLVQHIDKLKEFATNNKIRATITIERDIKKFPRWYIGLPAPNWEYKEIKINEAHLHIGNDVFLFDAKLCTMIKEQLKIDLQQANDIKF